MPLGSVGQIKQTVYIDITAMSTFNHNESPVSCLIYTFIIFIPCNMVLQQCKIEYVVRFRYW